MPAVKKESYYELLNITPTATTGEIVEAYDHFKLSQARDSTVLSTDDKEKIQAKIEHAYHTLTNPKTRHDYDKSLNLNTNRAHSGPSASDRQLQKKAKEIQQSKARARSKSGSPVDEKLDRVDGEELRKVREQRGYSPSEVCEITKISSTFLAALEGANVKKLPARVYVQGFVKNLAHLYQLDISSTVKAYLEHFDLVSDENSLTRLKLPTISR